MGVCFNERIQSLICFVREFSDIPDNGTKVLGLGAGFLYGRQFIEYLKDGFKFPFFAVNDDLPDYLPQVFFSIIYFFAATGRDFFISQTPIEQCPEVHTHITAGNVELRFNLVGAEWFGRDEQKRVHLSHGRGNAPSASHFSPRFDKFLFALANVHAV